MASPIGASLGLDLGGTKIEIIALDETSQELYRKRVPTPRENYDATLNAIEGLVAEAERALGATSLPFGIGIPGALSLETGLVKNANSTWLIGHPLKEDLQQTLKRPIALANDADCFALSEASDGNAAGFKNVFGVIIGTGVGGGLVINGSAVSGPNAITGEWGHTPLPQRPNLQTISDPDTQCYCGRQNCIETYLSGPGFAALHANTRLEEESRSTKTASDIFGEMRTGDIDATESYAAYLDRLARGLSNIINIIDPDCIVFGGGLSNVSELYRDLPDAISPYVFSDSVRTRFVQAKHGDSSGVRGAAWLARAI